MIVNLEEVSEIVNDKKSSDFLDDNSYVTTENMLTNREGVKFPAKNLPKNLEKVNSYKKGDILISNIRPYFKKIWLADRDGTSSGDVLIFRSISNLLLQEYLYLVLQTDVFFNYMTATSTGTKMPRGNKEAIKRFKFHLPNIEQQKSVLKKILLLERKVQLNNQINANLVELAKNYWAQFKANSKTEKLSISELSNSVITGKTPSKKRKEYYENGFIPFIKIPDMHNKIFVTDTTEKLSSIGANSQKSKFIPKETIIVSCIGTPGLVSITSEECQTNQQINSVIIDKNIIYAIFLELHNLRDYIINLGSGGTTINNLNKSDFQNIVLTVPSINEMSDFCTQVKPMFDQILCNDLENKNLCRIKNELLNKLF